MHFPEQNNKIKHCREILGKLKSKDLKETFRGKSIDPGAKSLTQVCTHL